MKRPILSALVIALAISLVGGGVLARPGDAETSRGNDCGARTMDLKIRDGDNKWRDGITVAEWTLSNMKPGVSETTTGTIELKNEGTIAGHHVEIGCSYTASEGRPTGDMDTVNQNLPGNWDSFARFLEITYFRYAGDNWWIKYVKGVGYSQSSRPAPPQPTRWKAADWRISEDGDGILSLYDLMNDPLDNLPPPNVGRTGPTQFDMKVRFHENAGNNLQGDTLNLTVTFTLNQDSSQ